MKNHNTKHIWALLAVVFLVLASGMIGYCVGINRQQPADQAVIQTEPVPTQSVQAETKPKLQRNLVFTFLEKQTADPDFHIANVNTFVNAGSEKILLQEGLDSGQITQAMLAAMARLDAANGFCKETFQSHNGLSEFVYQYPELDLSVTYDVYELPNGELHLTDGVSVTNPNEGFRGNRVFFGEDREHYRLDLEDWGLIFQVSNPDSEGILLHAEQTDGQQIGVLQLTSYSIQAKDGYLQKPDGMTRAEITPWDIQMGGSKDIKLNWQDTFGTLEPGAYTLELVVTDHYEHDQVHPLMKNFYDTQYYYCDFVIK